MNSYPLLQMTQLLQQKIQPHHKAPSYTDPIHQYLKDAQGQFSLEYIFSQLGETSQEVFSLQQSNSVILNSPQFYFKLAKLLIQNKHLELAETCLHQATKLAPESSEGYFILANFYITIGNFNSAIENYNQVLELNPNHSKAMLCLAKVYLEHRQFQSAIKFLNLYLKIYPGQVKVKQDLRFAKQRLKYKNQKLSKSQPYVSMADSYPNFKEENAIHAYIQLLKKCLTDTVHVSIHSLDYQRLAEGLLWPLKAETMIGMKRLDNLHYCVSQILQDKILGDFIETGVWKGGACILMRGILKAYSNVNRKVWVVDSFEGLPLPNETLYPQDSGCQYHSEQALNISLEKVQENFIKYDLLDNQVVFLKGLFKDTLPQAPIEQIAILRLDGDMYESTMDALIHLYPKLVIGGFIIIDDYGALLPCRQAVQDYRKKHHIIHALQKIDHSGIYWRRLY